MQNGDTHVVLAPFSGLHDVLFCYSSAYSPLTSIKCRSNSSTTWSPQLFLTSVCSLQCGRILCTMPNFHYRRFLNTRKTFKIGKQTKTQKPSRNEPCACHSRAPLPSSHGHPELHIFEAQLFTEPQKTEKSVKLHNECLKSVCTTTRSNPLGISSGGL